MRATYADEEHSGHHGDVASSGTERLLLYVILLAGYGFLGFFGWLLTL